MSDKIKPSEVSEVLQQQLQEVNGSQQFDEVGTVLTVSDGVARIYGLRNAEANELLDDVPVDALDVMQRIAFLHPSQFVPGEFSEPFDDGMKQDEQAQPDASDTCSYFFEFSLHR